VSSTVFSCPSLLVVLGAVIGALVGGTVAHTFVGRIFTGPAALATIVAYVWLAERWMCIQGKVTHLIALSVVRLVFFIIACGPYALVGACIGAHRFDLALMIGVLMSIGSLLWLFVFFPPLRGFF
jgi:hypothetical protein